MTDALAKLMTVKETAEMLAVSISTLRDLVRVGEIAFIQKGRGSERQHMSFHPQDIDDYIKRSRTRLRPVKGIKRVTPAVDTPAPEGFLAQRAARKEAKMAARKKWGDP